MLDNATSKRWKSSVTDKLEPKKLALKSVSPSKLDAIMDGKEDKIEGLKGIRLENDYFVIEI